MRKKAADWNLRIPKTSVVVRFWSVIRLETLRNLNNTSTWGTHDPACSTLLMSSKLHLSADRMLMACAAGPF
jgi:hypothetical protein